MLGMYTTTAWREWSQSEMEKMCFLQLLHKQCRNKDGGGMVVVGVYGMYGTSVQSA